MVDNMNSIQRNAHEKIYTTLLTSRGSFEFSKKNYFFKK